MKNKYDIFNFLYAQEKWKAEPVNTTIGRLRMAIKLGESDKRKLLLLEKISNDVIDLGVKFPEEVGLYK